MTSSTTFEDDFVNESLPISISIRLDAIRFPTRSDSALPTPADFDLAADFCRFLPIRLRSGSDAAFHDDVRRQMRSRTHDDEYDDEYDDKYDE